MKAIEERSVLPRDKPTANSKPLSASSWTRSRPWRKKQTRRKERQSLPEFWTICKRRWKI